MVLATWVAPSSSDIVPTSAPIVILPQLKERVHTEICRRVAFADQQFYTVYNAPASSFSGACQLECGNSRVGLSNLTPVRSFVIHGDPLSIVRPGEELALYIFYLVPSARAEGMSSSSPPQSFEWSSVWGFHSAATRELSFPSGSQSSFVSSHSCPRNHLQSPACSRNPISEAWPRSISRR